MEFFVLDFACGSLKNVSINILFSTSKFPFFFLSGNSLMPAIACGFCVFLQVSFISVHRGEDSRAHGFPSISDAHTFCFFKFVIFLVLTKKVTKLLTSS